MADLNDINAAQSVKIIGSDSIGIEQTPVGSTSNGDLKVVDYSNNGGTQGFITVSTTAVEVKVGGSALSNRKNVTAFNNGSQTLYWGYNSSVTTTTGTLFFKNQMASWDVGPNTTIYLIAASGSHNVRVTENA